MGAHKSLRDKGVSKYPTQLASVTMKRLTSEDIARLLAKREAAKNSESIEISLIAD